jgi:4-amino-4-deoxy-L-arabinose transferase-like glycosyltransferase
MEETVPPLPSSAGISRLAPPRTGLLALGLLLAVLIGFFQFASGSRQSELGSHPDEAAHFVTGLMARDYLASGFHEAPLRYADEYYRHYPKIGLGVWPPFFYLVQAIWTLVFPVGVRSVLLLMATIELALALATGWRLWREYGWAEGLTGAVLLTALPLVQQYSNMVMAEVLSALLMFSAVLCFGQFLDSEGKRGATGFGVFAGLAIMTKGTGLALAFVPVLAIAFTGRFQLIKNPRLWMAAIIVLTIAGPWTWHFRNQGRGGWEEPNPSVHFTVAAISFYGRQLLVASGWLVALLAIAGALAVFLGPTRPGLPASSLALVLGVWIFQCLTPVGLEARHLTPAMPCIVVLAMAGLNRLVRSRPRVVPAACAGLLAMFSGMPLLSPAASRSAGYGSLGNDIAVSPFRIPRKEWGGFSPLAEAALAGNRRHLLVASDARGEGMFIADVAMRDPHRPGFTVDRASKILAASTWSGGGYQSFYSTPGQIAAALAKSGVEAVIIDSSPSTIPPHQQLLQSALSNPGGEYHLHRTSMAVRDGKKFPAAAALFLRGASLNP